MVNYKQVRLCEVIYQRVQDAANKAPMIHFTPSLWSIVVWVLSPFSSSALRLWQMQVSSVTRNQSSERSVNRIGGRKSSTLVVMNRYHISSEIILCKLLCVKEIGCSFFLFYTSQHNLSERIQPVAWIVKYCSKMIIRTVLQWGLCNILPEIERLRFAYSMFLCIL